MWITVRFWSLHLEGIGKTLDDFEPKKKKKKSEGNALDCSDSGCCIKNTFKRVEARRPVGK